MLTVFRKLTPKPLLAAYHRFLSVFSDFWYGHPSRKMIVIGVTGTNGKTTAVNIIGRMLEAIGAKVGWTATVNFKVADEEWLNDTKMTMLGRFALQKLLRRMQEAGCTYAIVETSSEGLCQFRHLGINYDAAVFLNLTPEHIESHGSFENYKRAKGELFRHLTGRPRKKLGEMEIPKVSVVNIDDEHVDFFLGFPADRKIGYTLRRSAKDGVHDIISAADVKSDDKKSVFFAGGTQFELPIPGPWNVAHALAAISLGRALGFPFGQLSEALRQVKPVPGRLEEIREGQPFRVLIDYAPQPQSLRALYAFIRSFHSGRMIHVLGSAGGGRDKSRRPVLGDIAGRNADLVIVTNEDPYDENPQTIIDQVAEGARAAGKMDGADLFRIPDRREAIGFAVRNAVAGDLLLLTGKGAEQAIMGRRRKKIPWDERQIVREAIRQNYEK